LREHRLVLWVGDETAHVFGAGGGRIQTRNDGRAGASADRGARPAVEVDHALRRQAIDVWRGGVRVAVATQVRAVVLAGQPEDVRGRGVSGHRFDAAFPVIAPGVG